MKKIAAFLKKYQLIIFLALVASLLFGLKLTLPPEEKVPLVTPTPTPSPSPTPQPEVTFPGEGRGTTEEELVKELAANYPLSAFLPYPDERVTIVYVKELTLEITIEPGSGISYEDVLNWISDQGVDPKTHQIIWK